MAKQFDDWKNKLKEASEIEYGSDAGNELTP